MDFKTADGTPVRFTFNVDGVKVTGMIYVGQPRAIVDGAINGDTITFKVTNTVAAGDRINSFTGRLNGDMIAFTRSVQLSDDKAAGGAGIFGTLGLMQFTAKRDIRRVESVNVGGHRMRVQSAGLAQRKPNEPVVVLESGAISTVENWEPVFDQIAALAPVIAYDRRGLGESEFDGEAPTLKHVTESLHALLGEVKASPPYLLVGHSYGGMLINTFAHDFPREVAGMVYLDAPDMDMTFAEMDAISPDTRRIFLGELDQMPPNLSEGMQAEIVNITKITKGNMEEARAFSPPAGIPKGVLIAAGKYLHGQLPAPPQIAAALMRLQIRHEQEWALLSPHGVLMIATDLNHQVHHDDPAMTVQLIKQILASASRR